MACFSSAKAGHVSVRLLLRSIAMHLNQEPFMITSELIRHLKRQIVFLKNSIAAYDRGDVEEAVRIAVVLRVLCHDHGTTSISLFQQLGANAPKLISTGPPASRVIPPDIDFGTLLSGQIFGHTIEFGPVDRASPEVDYPQWWGERIFIRDRKMYSRKDVVLAAANKDGGAHVDEPNRNLTALVESFWVRTSTLADGSKVVTPIENNHFAILRRLGEELLVSSELVTLVS